VIISEQNKDTITELINIAFGRTAASLSELTGCRVLLDVPQVAIYPIGDLFANLSGIMKGDVATVHQPFSGMLGGDALLMLDYEGAALLAGLLMDESPPASSLNMSAREVLTEVGNILLNACLGMFGNLLHVHVSFALPRLHLDALDGILKSIILGKEELRYALLVRTSFRLRDNAVSGYLVIVLGVASLDRLIHAIEKMEDMSADEK
jgi:chemotaxis protein CheC